MGRRALIWLAVAVAMGSAFGVGFELRAHSLRPPSPGAATASGPLRAQVLAELAGHYYENVPARATQAHTVNGVLAALGDPYTEYLAPAAYRDLLESQAGGYAGVGLALARGPNGLIVRASLPGLPAWKAGIRPGDVITAVDDRNLAGVPYGSAVGLIHGASGTPVHLLIQRPGQHVPVLLTLVREPVRLTRVTSERMGEGAASVVVIRIPAFSEGTAADVRRIVTAAVARPTAGIVLDLRGDLGGLLSEAIGVARVFINQGVIVNTGGAHERSDTLVADGTAVRGVPRLAILIDGTTASAAELVAGSLRHDLAGRGAMVVGARSFGKGTIQAIHPLPNGGALKLTVAVFRLAGGVPVGGRGIRPDVAAPDRPQTDVDETLQAALQLIAPPA